MAVLISGTFRKDDREFNGLERVTETLIKHPYVRHVVVGVIETTQIVRDIQAGGVETPRVRFVHIEALDEATGADQAKRILEAAYTARTGAQPDTSLFDHDQVGENDVDEA